MREHRQHGPRFMGALGSVGTDLRRVKAPPAPQRQAALPLPDLVRIAGCCRRGRMWTEFCGEEERRRPISVSFLFIYFLIYVY
jgi:hypothetical protein